MIVSTAFFNELLSPATVGSARTFGDYRRSGLDPAGCLRNLSLGFQSSVKIDFLTDHAVGFASVWPSTSELELPFQSSSPEAVTKLVN